jgi:CheY-like chemotaxis protein
MTGSGEFRDRTERLRVERLRLGLYVLIAAAGLFAGADWLMNPQRLHLLYLIKLGLLTVCAGILRALRRPDAGRHAVALGLLGVATLSVSTAASGVVTHDVITTPVLVVVLSLGTAMLLSWGVWPQAATAVLAGVASVATIYGVDGTLGDAFRYPALVIFVALGVSVCLAHATDGWRAAVEQRAVALEAAHQQLRESEERFRSAFHHTTVGMALVASDVLDFSKIEAGKLEIDPVEFQLHDLLNDTLKLLAVRAHQKGLELVCDIAPDVADAVVGDAGRLRQVLVNLVGNALKFTERGEVELKVSVAERGLHAADLGAVGCRDAGSEPPPRADQPFLKSKSTPLPSTTVLHFVVRDTGIGIARDQQQAIFAAFAQADGSMTRKYGGTGLGLTISSRLVELMGGRMWVESEAARGSRFHFTIRLGVEPAPRSLLALPRAALRGLPVLVVDDNATNRRFLYEVLRCWGMRPKLVPSGRAALAALLKAAYAGRPYPLALLDVHMPELDGLSLAALIRDHPQITQPTMIMLTSGDHVQEAARCRELGLDACLAKPIKQCDLQRAILKGLGVKGIPGPTPTRTGSAARAGAAPHRRLRVLLAEDSVVNQRLAVRLLEKRGHRVVLANNGQEALAAWVDGAFDLILMDVQMPFMGGLDVTAEIRRREAAAGSCGHAARVPIVAMTAHAMQGDADRCLAAGMDAYVAKPVQGATLFAVIEAVVAGGAAPPAGFEQAATQ